MASTDIKLTGLGQQAYPQTWIYTHSTSRAHAEVLDNTMVKHTRCGSKAPDVEFIEAVKQALAWGCLFPSLERLPEGGGTLCVCLLGGGGGCWLHCKGRT